MLIKTNLLSLSSNISSKILKALTLWFVFLLLTLLIYNHTSLKFWNNSLPVSGDGLLITFLIEQLRIISWVDFVSGRFIIDNLGWPGKSELFLFPIGNTIDLGIIKLLDTLFFEGNASQLLLSYVILRFPTTVLVTYLCLKTFISYRLDRLLIAVVFSYSPFVFTRAEGHFVLASVWTIPIFVSCFYKLFLLPNNQKSRAIAYLGLLIVGLNNFYFAIFSVIIMLVIIFIRVISEILNFQRFGRLWAQNKTAIYGSIVCIFGLALQVIPNYLRQKDTNISYSLGKRGLTEGYIYAGDWISLFADLGRNFLSSIGRPDIRAFLETKVTWEASQFGTLGSILFLILLLLPILYIWRERQFSIDRFDSRTLFLYGILSISTFLYLKNPFTSFFTAYIGGIRAWGRMVPIIHFIVILLFFHMLRNRKIIKYCLVVILILPLTWNPLNQFSESRPPAIQLSTQSVTDERALESNFSPVKFNSKSTEGCPIVVLPIHPFPEFDYPYDNLPDYWNLRFTKVFEQDVKWNIGSLKNSSSYKHWQFLQSEVPPFHRASVYTQVGYSLSLKPCLIVIDKFALSIEERNQLESVIKDSKLTARNLGVGVNCIINQQDLLIIRVNICEVENKSKQGDFYEELSSSIFKQNFFWQNITSGSVGFNGAFQMFPFELPQTFRFSLKANEKSSFKTLVRVNTAPSSEPLILCIQQGESQMCKTLALLKDKTFVADFNLKLSQKPDLVFSVRNADKRTGYLGIILVDDTYFQYGNKQT